MLWRSTFLLSSAVDQVCLGLTSPVYSLLRACLRMRLYFLFACASFLGCCFFFHDFSVFPPFKIAKRVLHFFACLYVGIFRRVDIARSHNNLFVYLLSFLLFCFKYVIACLLYFLQLFCWLLSCYFLSMDLICIFLFFCRFLPVQLARFGRLLAVAICFFLCFGLVKAVALGSVNRFVVFPLFFMPCFAHFTRLFFFFFLRSFAPRSSAVFFIFLLPPCLFSCSSVVLTH